MDEIAANIPLQYTDQQELLSETDLQKRYEKLAFRLVNEMEIMNIKEEIRKKVKNGWTAISGSTSFANSSN